MRAARSLASLPPRSSGTSGSAGSSSSCARSCCRRCVGSIARTCSGWCVRTRMPAPHGTARRVLAACVIRLPACDDACRCPSMLPKLARQGKIGELERYNTAHDIATGRTMGRLGIMAVRAFVRTLASRRPADAELVRAAEEGVQAAQAVLAEERTRLQAAPTAAPTAASTPALAMEAEPEVVDESHPQLSDGRERTQRAWLDWAHTQG
eukprot:5505512-Prymnesium_polylepis.2